MAHIGALQVRVGRQCWINLSMSLSSYQSSSRSLLLRRERDLQKSQFHPSYVCWICGNAVDLESCKADENGIAVHEDCYCLRVALAAESMRLAARKPPHSIRRIIVPDGSERNVRSSNN